MADVFCGIDIGTSSSKGVLVTADGEIVARASRAHETATPRPGWVEHDADGVWWTDFHAITRELTATGHRLAGLAVSGIGPVLLPADGAGTSGVYPGTWSLAAGMATSGAITDWLRKLVGTDFATLVAEAAEVPPGSRGLLLLPYFAGERTPIFDRTHAASWRA